AAAPAPAMAAPTPAAVAVAAPAPGTVAPGPVAVAAPAPGTVAVAKAPRARPIEVAAEVRPVIGGVAVVGAVGVIGRVAVSSAPAEGFGRRAAKREKERRCNQQGDEHHSAHLSTPLRAIPAPSRKCQSRGARTTDKPGVQRRTSPEGSQKM